jgi:nucleotide-binding universal stress UspA family protein
MDHDSPSTFMTDTSLSLSSPIERIFHPTDFSSDSHVAFAHALKLALLAKAELTIMHVDPTVTPEGFEDFPRIRPTLERWGVLPEGSTKPQVVELGLRIKKIRALADNPRTAIIHHLTRSPTDLMVLAANQHEGLTRLLHDPVATPVSRAAHVTTLFVPSNVQGFVSLEHGRTALHRILLPVSRDPSPTRAIQLAATLATLVGGDGVSFKLVHAGGEGGVPTLDTPQHPGWSWDVTAGDGNPVEWILASGAEYDVDLIAMMTKGHNGFLDSLLGSVTERVLRGARCPVLAVPT